mmetsp:Transcript_613/g.971  ORF Transcript_613/g.971 Transcript_613/m.971 type:complete len:253 (-) Transcript_613:369-1127(-)
MVSGAIFISHSKVPIYCSVSEWQLFIQEVAFVMPWCIVVIRMAFVMVPVILPQCPQPINIGMMYPKDWVSWTPVGLHVTTNNAVNQHVRSILIFYSESVHCIVPSRSIGILIIIGNHRQHLRFTGKGKSLQEFSFYTTKWTIINAERPCKGRVSVVGNSIVHTWSAIYIRSFSPGTKGVGMHDVRVPFPFCISLPIPVRDVDTFASGLLKDFFEVPNEPAMPREKLRSIMRELSKPFMDIHKIIVLSRFFHQ